MREAYPFGPNLRLKRIWRTELGADWIELEDLVTNEGFRPELHMLLYHWNFGFPFLNEKTTLSVTADTVTARDETASRSLARWSIFEPPREDFQEQVFFHSYSSEPPQTTRICIYSGYETNPVSVELTYLCRELPELTQWKCCRKGLYVLGIEPGNCRPEGREQCRGRNGQILAPQESAHFQMRLRIVAGSGSQ